MNHREILQTFEWLLRLVHPGLTRRQVQVCARALLGMTNVAIASDLDVRVPTVATLRRRAYAALRISSLNELFALCLTQALRRAVAIPNDGSGIGSPELGSSKQLSANTTMHGLDAAACASLSFGGDVNAPPFR